MKLWFNGNIFVWIAFLLFIPPLSGAESSLQTTNQLRRGFYYFHDEIPQGPWSVHGVKIDRHNSSFELHTTLAKSNHFGLTLLTEQIKSLPLSYGKPIAAINGDYYSNSGPYTGDPKGLQIMRGELISGPCDWTCFWMDPAGTPQMTNVISRFEAVLHNNLIIPFALNEERSPGSAVLYTTAVGASSHVSGGIELILEKEGTGPWLPLQPARKYTARIREIRKTGDTPITTNTMVLSVGPELLEKYPSLSQIAAGGIVTLSTHTLPDLIDVKTAIGGGPALVRNGKPMPRKEANVRHPRSAIGWNADYLYMMVVDGRQINLSVGMTYQELADYMIKLGCVEAMSLDGGGSTTFWAYGQVMNNPSEGRERGMANALVLVRKENK